MSEGVTDKHFTERKGVMKGCRERGASGCFEMGETGDAGR